MSWMAETPARIADLDLHRRASAQAGEVSRPVAVAVTTQTVRQRRDPGQESAIARWYSWSERTVLWLARWAAMPLAEASAAARVVM